MSTAFEWVLTPVPTPLDARELLSGLLGREVTVQQVTSAFVGDVGAGTTYAVYQDDQARTRAVAVMDLAMSAYAGAAIGLMPVGAAEVAIEDKDLPPVMQENLGEVLNVLAALLNAQDCPHVRLTSVVHVGSTPDGEVAAQATAVGRRLDLEVSVPQFGTGRLSIVGLK
jgi:hypothetical protein